MPMADYYLLTRAHITADYITAQYARELYDRARARPQTALTGDLETGFYFWTLSDAGLRLVHCRVIPLRADQVPDIARRRLDAPPGATVRADLLPSPRSPWWVVVPSAQDERATPPVIQAESEGECLSPLRGPARGG
jgi:hypothetical protein